MKGALRVDEVCLHGVSNRALAALVVLDAVDDAVRLAQGRLGLGADFLRFFNDTCESLFLVGAGDVFGFGSCLPPLPCFPIILSFLSPSSSSASPKSLWAALLLERCRSPCERRKARGPLLLGAPCLLRSFVDAVNFVQNVKRQSPVVPVHPLVMQLHTLDPVVDGRTEVQGAFFLLKCDLPHAVALGRRPLGDGFFSTKPSGLTPLCTKLSFRRRAFAVRVRLRLRILALTFASNLCTRTLGFASLAVPLSVRGCQSAPQVRTCFGSLRRHRNWECQWARW